MKLTQIRKILEENSVEDAEFEALELICRFEKVTKAKALFEDFQSEELISAINRRISGEPLQYILGEWEFMGIPLKVTPDCLIPRFDTEILCEYLIKNLPEKGKFADLCTGSGCIAVAGLCLRPDSCATAVELYENTLNIAKENAEKNGVSKRISFIQGDVTKDVLGNEKFDIIVSNPPYVTVDEMKELSREVKKEPPHALTDGGDGLSVIKKITELYPKHLKKGGTLAVEIGWKQGEAVRKIAAENGLLCEILKDTGNRDRVAVFASLKWRPDVSDDKGLGTRD